MTKISLSRLRQLQLVTTKFSVNPWFYNNLQNCTSQSRSLDPIAPRQVTSQSRPLDPIAQIIKRKVYELRSRSTLRNPWCLECGCPGHIARDCVLSVMAMVTPLLIAIRLRLC